jgi:hypothetical protein
LTDGSFAAILNEYSFIGRLTEMQASRNQGGIKSRLDAAALHLFAERGADATPVPMIA